MRQLDVSRNIADATMLPLGGAVRLSRAVGCLLGHAPINYFLAAVVVTKTSWLAALAPG